MKYHQYAQHANAMQIQGTPRKFKKNRCSEIDFGGISENERIKIKYYWEGSTAMAVLAIPIVLALDGAILRSLKYSWTSDRTQKQATAKAA